MNLALLFVILLPISAIILAVSMSLTSKAMGGVEFGPVHVVLLKGAVLILLVDLIALIPNVGIWLTLPVWWFGLMILFRIDFWEARTLVVINWVLNLIVRLLLANLLSHGATSTRAPANEDQFPPGVEDQESRRPGSPREEHPGPGVVKSIPVRALSSSARGGCKTRVRNSRMKTSWLNPCSTYPLFPPTMTKAPVRVGTA
jgi:hypothetical protein